MYSVTVSPPGSPKGATVLLDGIGEVTVGEPFEVSDELHEQFRARNGHVDDETGEFVPGPTLAEAVKDTEWITVAGEGSDE